MARHLSKDEAVEIARRDAAKRTGVEVDAARANAVDATFPDSVLGAPRSGEWAADMQTKGWTIHVTTSGRELEYRASPRQVRLVDAAGIHHLVFPD